jgi:hypothetical protein
VRHLSKAEIEENYNRLYDDLMGSGGGGDFAARMMKKMGWQEGKGPAANSLRHYPSFSAN